jgi:hypothetical protein
VVDASSRGRGVARKLLRAALEDVGADGAAWLDASDMGISLYEKAGFEPRSRVVRWTKDVPSGLPDGMSRETPGDAPARLGTAFDDDENDANENLRVVRADEENGAFGAAARMDAEVFGADREAFLRAWVASAPPGASCLDERVGYALAHRRGNATYLGPWGLAEAAGEEAVGGSPRDPETPPRATRAPVGKPPRSWSRTSRSRSRDASAEKAGGARLSSRRCVKTPSPPAR